MRRPKDWENMTLEDQMKWLRKQRKKYKGGRRGSIKEEDKERVWSLMKKYDNKTIVADLLGVHRRTVQRYLETHPIPRTFVLDELMNLKDFPEIQTFLKRCTGFAKKITINRYMVEIRRFYEWMKKYHPERAKPSLWSSDDIVDFVYGNEKIGWKGHEPYQWHTVLVPLRQLAKKTQAEFPSIDLGMLPTKKTHKAKRSLAGKEEYYLEPEQVSRMIQVAEEKRDRGLIAFLYNIALRTGASTKVRIEDLDLNKHFVKIRDKGDIVWLVHGLTDQTCQLLREYLEERGYPKTGWLFTNGEERQLKSSDVNKIIKKLGKKAGIEGKVLTAKVFRKSMVKNALEHMGMNPVSLIGTGKNTKTCFCVGWTDMKVLMEHYAPQLMTQIEEDRQKFLF